MEVRPKIKIELTPSDNILEIMGWVALIGLWILILVNYSNLPETIPTHFNGAGKVDSYGNKATLFMLPIIATVAYIGLTVLNNYPHIFNYPTKLTAENALRQYTNATKMIRYLKLVIVLVFSLIVFMTLRTAAGQSDGLGAWFLPFTLGLIFVPLGIFVIQSFKK
jgi:uncharacterized membrane protein